MALTITSVVVDNDVTMTAGAGDVTSSDQDLTAAYQKGVRVRITNGATGPTVAARVVLQISEDTTSGHYMTFATINGTSTNSDVIGQFITLPDTAMHLRVVSGSNTAQNTTRRVVIEKITSY